MIENVTVAAALRLESEYAARAAKLAQRALEFEAAAAIQLIESAAVLSDGQGTILDARA